MKNIVFLSLFASFLTLGQLDAQLPVMAGKDVAVAQTASGKVRGYIHNGTYIYKGIPYAKAARFESPAPVTPWEGVRSSMSYGPVCPLQEPTNSVQDEPEFFFHHDWGYTSEECLVLNVWTPGINDGKRRPVMFWIHGGGFTAGSSQELPSYDGENLSKKNDVVIVSVNHRLNILGFLDLSLYNKKYSESANVSMLDLVSALEWVKTNIANFGGDPGNVTIFGQSGGGAKVNTLMAMPKAQGLFHKAINQSGSFRMAILEKTETQRITTEVLKVLNLQPSQVDSLQKIPYAQLADAGKKALKTVEAEMRAAGKPVMSFGLSWGPSRDGTVLPDQLFSKAAFDRSKNIPLMIGTTKNEFVGSAFSGLSDATEDQVRAALQNRYKDKTDAFINAVRKTYPNDTRPSDLMDVDVIFRPGAVVQANEKSAIAGGAPVFMYFFSWQSPAISGKYKSMHCMELPFVFNNIARCEEMTGGGKEAYQLAEKMSLAWVQFARTGNPNHKGLPKWPAYNSGNTNTMFFDNKCKVGPQHDAEILKIAEGQ